MDIVRIISYIGLGNEFYCDEKPKYMPIYIYRNMYTTKCVVFYLLYSYAIQKKQLCDIKKSYM